MRPELRELGPLAKPLHKRTAALESGWNGKATPFFRGKEELLSAPSPNRFRQGCAHKYRNPEKHKGRFRAARAQRSLSGRLHWNQPPNHPFTCPQKVLCQIIMANDKKATGLLPLHVLF